MTSRSAGCRRRAATARSCTRTTGFFRSVSSGWSPSRSSTLRSGSSGRTRCARSGSFATACRAARPAFPGREVSRSSLLRQLYVFGTPTSILFRADIVRRRDPFYEGERYPSNCDAAACYEILREWDFGFAAPGSYVHSQGGTRHCGRVRPAGKVPTGENPDAPGIWAGLSLARRVRAAAPQERSVTTTVSLRPSIFAHRGKEFWTHQRAAMRELGLSSSRARLVGRHDRVGVALLDTSLPDLEERRPEGSGSRAMSRAIEAARREGDAP